MTNITANATRVRMGRNGSVANSRTILYELRRAVGLPVPDVEWSIPDGRGGVAYADALRHCIDAPAAGGCAGLPVGAEIAERARRRVDETEFDELEPGRRIGISLGVETWLEASDDVESIIKRVDELLYRAKESGRNRVVVAARTDVAP